MAWPEDKKPYRQFEDPRLTKNQGGIPSGNVAAEGAELLGRAAVAPAQAVGVAVDKSPVMFAARQAINGIGSAANTLSAANANNQRALTPNSELPAAQTMRPVSPVQTNVNYSTDRSKMLGLPQSNFATDVQGIGTPITDYRNNPAIAKATANATDPNVDFQKTIYNIGDKMYETPSRAITRPGSRQAIGGGSILDSRQPGQRVNYSNGGLNVQFAGNTPTDEIQRFTGTHSALTSQRAKDDAAAQGKEMARAALNGGRGPGPERPVMPNIAGMRPREAATLMDGYKAALSSHDNWQNNVTQVKNYDANNENQKEQNRLTGEHYKAADSGTAIDNQTKQLGLNRETRNNQLLQQAANAKPGSPEAEEAIRQYGLYNPPKEQPDSVMALNTYTDGQIDGQRLVNKKDGSPVGGQQKRVPTPNEEAAWAEVKAGKATPKHFQDLFGYLPE